ncbi:MAG: hypothetical protein RL172_2128 [Bacteroidota bacterium]
MFNVFNIQLMRLAEWLIPTFLRKEVLMAFVTAIYTPLVALHNSFSNYRSAKFYQIAMNYQVCYLEAFLNDRFDYTNRGIYIDDPDDAVPALYLYQDAEDVPVYLYQDAEDVPVYLYQDAEVVGAVALDFIVMVPVAVAYDENEMRAMIATKLCGKKYSIQTY